MGALPSPKTLLLDHSGRLRPTDAPQKRTGATPLLVYLTLSLQHNWMIRATECSWPRGKVTSDEVEVTLSSDLARSKRPIPQC